MWHCLNAEEKRSYKPNAQFLNRRSNYVLENGHTETNATRAKTPPFLIKLVDINCLTNSGRNMVTPEYKFQLKR